MQFLNGSTEIDHGSELQNVICNEINIPEENRYEFWENGGGMINVRSALKTKRATLTLSMKNRFIGKCLSI